MVAAKARAKAKGQKDNPVHLKARSAQSSPDSGTSRRLRRKPSSRQGSTRLAHAARRLLDLQSLLKDKMSEKEYNAARAVVYAGAGTHVCALLTGGRGDPPSTG